MDETRLFDTQYFVRNPAFRARPARTMKVLHLRGARMLQTDGQLLERFASGREDSAFATLVERHGPMVLGVCRRVLHDEHDAEDAFQAVFLVLARNAGTIRKRGALGSWLYGVAYRVAARLRSGVGARRARERQMSELPSHDRLGGDLIGAIVWRELRPLIDEELNRLPEKYRDPLVLCYLQGKTHDEAAQELGWSKGSMSRRMDKARELLRGRLSRRGITLSAGVILGVLAHNAAFAGATSVPAALVHKTVQAVSLFATGKTVAAGVISAQAAALSQGVLQTMFMSKLKMTAAVLLAMVVVGAGAGMTLQVLATPQTGAGTGAAAKPTGDVAQAGGEALPSAGDGAQAPSRADKGSMTAGEIRKLLTKPIDKKYEGGIDQNTPLQDLLDTFSRLFSVPIQVDYDAFVRQGHPNARKAVEDAKVGLRAKTGGTLARILKEVLAQVNIDSPETGNSTRVTYLVRNGNIVIVPYRLVVPDDDEVYLQGAPLIRALREPVSVSVEERPLKEALRELADASGANIVIDARVKEQVQTPVTAILQHVPLETAVRLMADMAEVKAVALDNVLYITDADNAATLAREQWQRMNGIGPGGDQFGAGMGVGPPGSVPFGGDQGIGGEGTGTPGGAGAPSQGGDTLKPTKAPGGADF